MVNDIIEISAQNYASVEHRTNNSGGQGKVYLWEGMTIGPDLQGSWQAKVF